jgi:hypothetical protein
VNIGIGPEHRAGRHLLGEISDGAGRDCHVDSFVFGRLGGLVLDDGDGAEELIGDVGEDGGRSGRDFVLCEEQKQPGEEVVARRGGFELGEISGEFSGGGFDALKLGVAGAKGRKPELRHRWRLEKRDWQRAALPVEFEISGCWIILVPRSQEGLSVPYGYLRMVIK